MERSMSVPGYVEVAFDDVLRAFGRESLIAELLDAAVAGAFPPAVVVRLHPSAPEHVSGRSARVKLGWELVDGGGARYTGDATVQLLVLQSGNEPLTELLLTVVVDDRYATSVAIAVHRFLDELVTRLAGVVSSSGA